MASQTAHDDEVLPFDQSDLHEGMGTVKKIVDLSGYTDEDGVYDGRCNYCGYDRATYESHTEIIAYTLICRQCEAVIGGYE